MCDDFDDTVTEVRILLNSLFYFILFLKLTRIYK